MDLFANEHYITQNAENVMLSQKTVITLTSISVAAVVLYAYVSRKSLKKEQIEPEKDENNNENNNENKDEK